MLSSGAVYLRTSVDDNAAAAFIYMSVESEQASAGRAHKHRPTNRSTDRVVSAPTGNFISENIAHHRLICVSATVRVQKRPLLISAARTFRSRGFSGFCVWHKIVWKLVNAGTMGSAVNSLLEELVE